MSREFIFHATSEADTERLGGALAKVLPPGSVVALVGTLGAGKTCLVQAVARAMGVPDAVATSPTFVLIHQYTQGRRPIYHFDAYRLRDEDEFLELGPEEYFDGEGITLVEWAERVALALPTDCIEIEMEVTGESSRTIRVAASWEEGAAVVQSLAQALSDCQ